MVKGQMSIEFIASVILVLFVLVLVVTGLFRAYNLLSSDTSTATQNLVAERVSLALLTNGTPASWEVGCLESVLKAGLSNPLSFAKLQALAGMGYGEQRFLVDNNFRLRVSYSPSIAIDTRFNNPLISPTLTVVESFELDRPMDLTFYLTPQANASIYVYLTGPTKPSVFAAATNQGSFYNLSVQPREVGWHELRVLAVSGYSFGDQSYQIYVNDTV